MCLRRNTFRSTGERTVGNNSLNSGTQRYSYTPGLKVDGVTFNSCLPHKKKKKREKHQFSMKAKDPAFRFCRDSNEKSLMFCAQTWQKINPPLSDKGLYQV